MNKEFKLSQRAWHARLNGFVYGRYYVQNQKNFCPYFWGTIAAFPLSILVAMVKGANKLPRVNINMPEINLSERQERVVIVGSLTAISALVGFGLYEAIIHGWIWRVLYFIALIIGPFALIRLSFWTNKKYRERNPYVPKPEKEPNMAVTAFKSWKDKNCPRITWK